MESQLPTRTVFSLAVTRSKLLCSYVLGLHILMLAGLISLFEQPLVKLMLIAIMSSSVFYYYRRYYLLTQAKSVTRLNRDSKEHWIIYTHLNMTSKPLILKQSYVSQYCVILYFNGSRFSPGSSVFIMYDAVDPELFRQLRVYCRDPKTFLK